MDDATLRLLVNRMIRAARLERLLYAEVAADITAMRQAIQVVVIVALVTAFATLVGDLLHSQLRMTAILGLIFSPILGIIGWLAWSGITWFVGTRLIEPGIQGVEFRQVARAAGFAEAPAILGIVAFIPVLGVVWQLALLVWVLAAGFVAIRESMHLTNRQAVTTLIAALVVGVIAYFILVIATIGALHALS
ncbi:MAG: YIP1 family protein [Chloroflexi bacterium]|nr:YIP1 family protein [Chloroflexota bacterium]